MKARYFLLLVLLFSGLGIYGLRQNNLGVRALVDRLIQADQAIQPTAALREEIRDFAASHTGADASFELTASYNRDLAVAQAAAQGGSAQGAVYAAAQAACASKADSIAQARCVSAYVASHAAPATGPSAPVLPQRSSYQYIYTAPVWAPDLAGLSFLAAIASLLAALTTTAMRLFRSGLRRRHER